jgi:hypothetical protein
MSNKSVKNSVKHCPNEFPIGSPLTLGVPKDEPVQYLLPEVSKVCKSRGKVVHNPGKHLRGFSLDKNSPIY